MSNTKCLICELENPEPKHYWTVHKIKEEDYYLKYFPKYDLLTGGVLPFKDRDSYLLNSFLNKNNFKQWLKIQSLEMRQDYLKQLLINRRELKGWEYIPTQVELRSCPELPGIVTYNENFDDYYKLCQELGYISRGFININERSIIKRTRNLKGNSIICDTREQELLSFGKKNIELEALKVGDYTLKEDNFDIFIERKSVSDLCSTFGPKNFDRFRNELLRAKEMGAYIILLVEHDINTALGLEYSKYYSRYTKMTSTFLFHQIRTLLQEIDNWQIAFCKSRTDMTEKIKYIFEVGEKAKSYDWQLIFDYNLSNQGI